MQYSVDTAGNALGLAAILTLHVLIGAAVIWSVVFGESATKSYSVTRRIFLGTLGSVFFVSGLTFLGIQISETRTCRKALSTNQYVEIAGEVEIIERFRKPGAGHDLFLIGDTELRTSTQGMIGDCGFISPLGSAIRLRTGDNVLAKVHNGRVVYLERKGGG